MSCPEPLLELLLRWEDRFDAGENLTPEDLAPDDPTLQQRLAIEIRKLLAWKQTTPQAPPTSATAEPPSGCPSLVTATTEYEIVAFHARGGLGEVFRARDTQLGREAAFKRMRPDRAGTPENRERFRREAEITSQLDHPGIVPIFARGTDADGHPFHTMRFVEGRSLKDACDAHHQDETADPAERRLRFRDLLGRLMATCQAVAYAHDRGVIHRDLKPGNVMLGQYGETQVVDWGLAKVIRRKEPNPGPTDHPGTPGIEPPPVGETGQTRPNQVMGSPGYMSPEQANGRGDEVGPASDVFSLGATLYHLLTGRAPYRGDGALADAQHARFDPPGKVVPGLPRALEAICTRAMAPDPRDRYASARDLAEDLGRWLADEPVRAWPEPWHERMRRWLRGHPRAAAAAVTLLVGGVIALAVGLRYVRAEQRETARALERSEENLELALENTDQIVRLAQDMKPLTGTQVNKLDEILGQANASIERALEKSPDSPRLLRSKGQVLLAFSEVRSFQGNSTQALEGASQARDLYQTLHDRDPEDTSALAGLASSHERIGALQGLRGQPIEALATFRTCIDLRRRLVNAEPGNLQGQFDLANAIGWLGVIHYSQNDHRAADEEHRRAQALYQDLVRKDPNDLRWRVGLATSLEKRADLRWHSAWTPQALKQVLTDYLEVHRIREEAARKEPSNARWQILLYTTRSALAETASYLDDRDLAARYFGEAIEMAQRFALLDPANLEWRSRELDSRRALAQFREKEDPKQAYRQMAAALRAQLAPSGSLARKDRQNVFWQTGHLQTQVSLAMTLAALARRGDDPAANAAQARELLGAALGQAEKLARRFPDDYKCISALRAVCLGYGAFLGQQGETNKGRQLMRRGYRLRYQFDERRLSRDPESVSWREQVADAAQAWATSLHHEDDAQQIVQLLRRALEVHDPLVRLEPGNAQRLKKRAVLEESLGRALFLQARGEARVRNLPDTWHVLDGLAPGAEAEKWFSRALATREQMVRLVPKDSGYLHLLANDYLELADRRTSRGQVLAGEEAFGKYLGTLSRLLREHPGGKEADPFSRTERYPLRIDEQAWREFVPGKGTRLVSTRSALLGLEKEWLASASRVVAQQLIGEYVNLVPQLDPSQPVALSEARWALRRGLSVFRQLRADEPLHPAHETLRRAFAAHLAKLSPPPWHRTLPRPVLDALASLDYRLAARFLLEQKKPRDLVRLLAAEAADAATVPWASPVLLRQLLEELLPAPTLCHATLQAAREAVKEEASLRGSEGLQLLAALARAAGDRDGSRALFSDESRLRRLFGSALWDADPESRTPQQRGRASRDDYLLHSFYRNWCAVDGKQAAEACALHVQRGGDAAPAWLRKYLIDALLASGQIEQAIETARQAHRRTPSDLTLLLGLGQALTAGRRFPEARTTFQEAMTRLKGYRLEDAVLSASRFGSRSLAPWSGPTQTLSQQFVTAWLAASALTSDDTASQPFQVERALLDHEQGESLAAEAALRRLLVTSPGDAVLQTALAWVLADGNRNLEEAGKQIHQALEGSREEPWRQLTLAVVLLRQKKHAEALPILNRLATKGRARHWPVLFQYLGEAHQQAGRSREARTCWERARTLLPGGTAPDDPRLALLLARLRDTPAARDR